MNRVYHCGKKPKVVCEAATYGNFDFPCEQCKVYKQIQKEKEKEKITNE